MGDGTEKQKLVDLKNSKNLHNVQFENFVSSENYSDLLKICSIGLVCLSSKNKTPVVPGKILGYMAAGIPIASFLHDESDGHQIVADAKCGITASSSNIGDCISKFELLMSKADDFALIGKNTSDAIRNGVQFGILGELHYMIESYEAKYPDLTIIMTGGDAHYFDFGQKNNIFADENFTLRGIYELYTFNAATI